LTQQRHDLFRTVSLLHLESFPALRAGRILSYSLDQVSGRAPPPLLVDDFRQFKPPQQANCVY
jgi:hypothetical protein